MSQHDMEVANAAGAIVRADINAALQALSSLQSGPGVPPRLFPFMLWADTENNLLKQRNAANNDWIIIGILDRPALDLEQLSHKGQAGGYAELDESGKVPFGQLPNLGGIPGYFSQLKVVNNGTTPASKMDLSAAVVSVSDNSSYRQLSGFAATVNCGVNGANGLDAGSLSNDNYYYFYVIAKADGTTAGLASLSPTAPTMPEGYTFKKLVSAIYYTGGAFRNIIQTGSWIEVIDSVVIGPYTDAVWTAKDISPYVPNNAIAAHVQPFSSPGSSNFQGAIAWDDAGVKNKRVFIIYSIGPQFEGAVASNTPFLYRLNPAAPQTLYVKQVNGNLNLLLCGYLLDI